MVWIFVIIVVVAVIVTAALACFFMGYHYSERSEGEIKVDTRRVEEAVVTNGENDALDKRHRTLAGRMTMGGIKVLESSKKDQSGEPASEPRMPSESEVNKVESRSESEEGESAKRVSPSRSIFRSAETTENIKTGVLRGPASSVADSQSGSTNAVRASSSTGQLVLPTPTTLTGTTAGSTVQSSYDTTSTRPNIARSVTHVPMCDDAGRTPPLCSPPRMDAVMKLSQTAI